MNLLTVTSDGDPVEPFEDEFDTVVGKQLEHVAPEIIDQQVDVTVAGESITAFDAAFFQIPTEQALFGRVVLEIMEEAGVKTNYPSTAFFTMAKKNYLYYVLKQKTIPSPDTAVVAAEKASRNIERELKGPIVARRLEELKEVEQQRLEQVDDIHDFANGTAYDDQFLLFHEYHSGDKYRCLVIGDRVIALEDQTDDYWFSMDDLQYSTPPTDIKETVLEAAQAIGAPVAEVLVIGDLIYDVNPNPDLDIYRDLAGKNTYSYVAEVLRGE